MKPKKIRFFNYPLFQWGSFASAILVFGGLVIEHLLNYDIGGLLSALGMLLFTVFLFTFGITKHYFSINQRGMIFRLSNKPALSVKLDSLNNISVDEKQLSYTQNDKLYQYDLSLYSDEDRSRLKDLVNQFAR